MSEVRVPKIEIIDGICQEGRAMNVFEKMFLLIYNLSLTVKTCFTHSFGFILYKKY